jgi:hypothetical protein
MSQENVERLRAFCQLWETRGLPDLSLLDPDVVFEDNVLPDHAGENYRGHEGVVRAARTWLEAYEESTVELERIAGPATGSSRSTASEERVGKAASKTWGVTRISGRFGTPRSFISSRFETQPMPSQRWGCGSSYSRSPTASSASDRLA